MGKVKFNYQPSSQQSDQPEEKISSLYIRLYANKINNRERERLSRLKNLLVILAAENNPDITEISYLGKSNLETYEDERIDIESIKKALDLSKIQCLILKTKDELMLVIDLGIIEKTIVTLPSNMQLPQKLRDKAEDLFAEIIKGTEKILQEETENVIYNKLYTGQPKKSGALSLTTAEKAWYFIPPGVKCRLSIEQLEPVEKVDVQKSEVSVKIIKARLSEKYIKICRNRFKEAIYLNDDSYIAAKIAGLAIIYALESEANIKLFPFGRYFLNGYVEEKLYASIPAEDRTVSGLHCIVAKTADDQIVVIDIGSLEGTQIFLSERLDNNECCSDKTDNESNLFREIIEKAEKHLRSEANAGAYQALIENYTNYLSVVYECLENTQNSADISENTVINLKTTPSKFGWFMLPKDAACRLKLAKEGQVGINEKIENKRKCEDSNLDDLLADGLINPESKVLRLL